MSLYRYYCQSLGSRLSCVTGCLLYMIVYVYMYYMLVGLSGCLNHIKGTIIIIIITSEGVIL